LCPCTVSIDQNRTHAQLTILKEQKQVGEEGKKGIDEGNAALI